MWLRLGVGIMGNVASMLLYAAPILTFTRVVRNKSTEEFSCVPYTIALLNCFLYTWYGLPVVSYGWENFPLVTINGLGIFLELSFIIVYLCYAPTNQKKKVTVLTALVIVAFSATALLSAYAFHGHSQRRTFVGSIGLIASVAMYGSPLVVVRQVIQTKSVEFMPFYLSLFSFIASSLWMAYGLLGHDLFLASPNLVGCPLGIFQLLIYCKYRKNGKVEKQSSVWDIEKDNDEKIIVQMQFGEKVVEQPNQMHLQQEKEVVSMAFSAI